MEHTSDTDPRVRVTNPLPQEKRGACLTGVQKELLTVLTKNIIELLTVQLHRVTNIMIIAFSGCR